MNIFPTYSRLAMKMAKRLSLIQDEISETEKLMGKRETNRLVIKLEIEAKSQWKYPNWKYIIFHLKKARKIFLTGVVK